MEIPCKVTRATNEVAKMVKVGYNTILAIDQATNSVHGLQVRLVIVTVKMLRRSLGCL